MSHSVIEEAVDARMYDSRWTPDQRKEAAACADHKMRLEAMRVDEALEQYRRRVRFWMLAEEMAK